MEVRRLAWIAAAAMHAAVALLLGACGGGGGGGGSSPPPQQPTVTLSANTTGVVTGSTVQLTWSSTNATQCTKSGGWSGATTPSGVEASGALQATTTFTLQCSGAGGSAQAQVTVTVVATSTVTLNGQILYERVPLGNNGLTYSSQAFVPLNAEVLIEVVDSATQAVVANGRFAANYQLTVPSARDVVLRATASMLRQAPLALPHWQIEVRDLVATTGAPLSEVYSFSTAAFNTGAGGMQNLQIPSGWTTTGQLTGPRHSAPFAILDSIQQGMNLVLSQLPDADFPALLIDWSPTNVGGQTFYSRSPSARRIVLPGEVNVDTEEYDAPVILHEFGHYIDDSFARSDSTGGPHSFGDRLDMRLAFGEGLATALSAMAMNSPLFLDSFGPGQANASRFVIENDSPTAEGWYNEFSTQELLWDIFDSSSDGSDVVSGGFQPIFATLRGGQHAQTPAMTSIFSFMTAYKQLQPADAAAISTLLTGEQIVGPTIDIYGSTETNNAGSADVLPVYTNIALGGTVQLRSTNQFGTDNKLSSHRFLRLTLAAQTNVRFVLTADAGRDADMEIFRNGQRLPLDMGPANEDFTVTLTAGDYVLDIFDCGNAGCNPGVLPAPTLLTLTVTSN